jgi:hypothetical protein
MKCQANFKDFKRFEAFKGLVEQKNVVFNSFVGSFHSRFKLAHSCQKIPNLHTNSLNKLLFVCKLKQKRISVDFVNIHD